MVLRFELLFLEMISIPLTTRKKQTHAAAAADCWLPRQPSTDWSGGLWQRKRGGGLKEREGERERESNGEKETARRKGQRLKYRAEDTRRIVAVSQVVMTVDLSVLTVRHREEDVGLNHCWRHISQDSGRGVDSKGEGNQSVSQKTTGISQ